MTDAELRKISLLDYLDALNYSYRQEQGDNYRDIQAPGGHIMSSFTYSKSKNVWNYHAGGTSGYGAYDYIKKIEGIQSPRDIMERLRSVMGIDDVERAKTVQQRVREREEKEALLDFPMENDDGEFHLPAQSPTTNELRTCLCQRRGIDQEVLDFFIDRKLVYESNTPYKRPEDGVTIYFHNAVYVARDKDGVAKAATWKSLKPEFDESGREYFKGGQIKHSDHLHYIPHYIAGSHTDMIFVFEAFTDAMAFLSLQKQKGRAWNSFSFACVEGISLSIDKPLTAIPTAFRQILDEHPEIKKVVPAFDNDQAGVMAADFFKKTLTAYQVVPMLPKKEPRQFTHGKDEFIKDWTDICMERKRASQIPSAEQSTDALLEERLGENPSIS